MAVDVPANYQSLVQAAATATGLPYAVVAAQAYTESGFNATAVSSSNAQGWLQFLPSTYDEYASAAGVPEGTEFNPADEEKVYVQYMKSLLGDYHGDVLEALNAYNGAQTIGGEPNPYGPDILKLAGEGDITVPTTGATTTSASGTSGDPFPGGNLDPLNWVYNNVAKATQQTLEKSFGELWDDFKTKFGDWGIRIGLILLGVIVLYAGLRSLTGIRASSVIQVVAPESAAANAVSQATTAKQRATSAPKDS
jgi:transglycosylase-like protein with SLT domain